MALRETRSPNVSTMDIGTPLEKTPKCASPLTRLRSTPKRRLQQMQTVLFKETAEITIVTKSPKKREDMETAPPSTPARLQTEQMFMVSDTQKNQNKPEPLSIENDQDAESKPATSEILSPRKRKAEVDYKPHHAERPARPIVKKIRREDIRPVLPSTCTAPVIWSADAGVDGKAICLKSDRCIIGTNDGRVLHLDLLGVIMKQQQLSAQVGAILKDGEFTYAWCHPRYGFLKEKGILYDITGEIPFPVIEVVGFGEWMIHAAVVDGCLVVGDDKGSMAVVKAGGEFMWKKEQDLGSGGYMSADYTGIYFAHKKTVTKYRLSTGELIWAHHVRGGAAALIQSATEDQDHIYAEYDGKIVQLSKVSGSVTTEYNPVRHRASGICVGNGLLVTGTCPTVVFHVNEGTELFRMNFAGRLLDSVSMIHSNGRMFTYWDKVYCVDLTERAIRRAIDGRSTRTMDHVIDYPKSTLPAEFKLRKAPGSGEGVIVEVTKVKGVTQASAKSTIYNCTYPVLLPLPLMYPGSLYVVDDLVESRLGVFYRVKGEIQELDPETVNSSESSATTTEEEATA